MELTDDTIRLREWRLEDAPAVAATCSDPEIQRWIPLVPSPYTETDAVTYVQGCIGAGESRHPFAIVDAADGRLYGAIDMTVNAMEVGEIGYWLAPHARGRGVCTAALRQLCHYAFDELRLGRLQLETDPDNAASQRVAEKVGFRREGVLRSSLRYNDGRRGDSVLFALLPGEL